MSGDDLHYRTFWLLVAWALLLAVIYLSLTPSPPRVAGRLGDQAGHVLAYAALTFWFCCLYAVRSSRAGIALALMMMGLVLELLQGLGGHRFADPLDVLANGLGIVLGWGLAQTPASRLLQGGEGWIARLHP